VEEWAGYGTTHFMPVAPTSDPYALIITEALLDGDTLQVGDEIAVYDWPVCAGACVVDGEWPMILDAWGAAGEDTGFTVGNTMVFRVWSALRDSTYEAMPTYEVSDGTFGDSVFSRLALAASHATGAEGDPTASPAAFSLSGVMPNPVSNEALAELAVPVATDVRVALYDLLGRESVLLADGRREAGTHRLALDARALPSGVYFIRATIPGHSTHRRVVLAH
jgi:hypothetical protein